MHKIGEGGQNTREANINTLSSAGDESQKEAISNAFLDVYRREPGPWHVPDVTTDNIARQVVVALSKSGDQLSNVTAKQAQSTLDFLQDLLDIQRLPLSYKRTFLKASLKLSRMYDCVPRCIMLRGFKKTDDHPFALGQFGEVWRGEVGGTEVAVKQARIFINNNDIKKVLRKIRREAIIWGQCDHPNVLPFYGIYRGSAPSSYCLVSPFMVNGSLRQYLSNDANPDRHRLGLDITRGMDYLHKMTIVHGDLKGDNILISDDHRAIIADFGISFVMGATTFGTSSSSRKGGTVKWQAPEVLNANPNSFSADVYSLACVYFEVFDGSMPWSDLTDGAVIMKVCVQKKHLPRPRFLSETDLWWYLMLQCWAHEPSIRPTVQDIMESLHATDDTLTSVMKWDRSILTRLRDPLVQGKLVVPSGLPSFLNVEKPRIHFVPVNVGANDYCSDAEPSGPNRSMAPSSSGSISAAPPPVAMNTASTPSPPIVPMPILDPAGLPPPVIPELEMVIIRPPPPVIPVIPVIPEPRPNVPPSVIRITFDNEYRDFCNHSFHRVMYNNQTYDTAMHLFEAMKFLPDNPQIADNIRLCKNIEDVFPLSAKFTQRYQRLDWGDVHKYILEEVLYHKYGQNPDVRNLLLKTGSAELVYSDPSDSYWSEGPDGRGQNHLGKALMRVRERLKAMGYKKKGSPLLSSIMSRFHVFSAML